VKYVTHHHVYLLNINSCAVLQTRNVQLRMDIEKSSLVVETEGPIRPIAASGLSHHCLIGGPEPTSTVLATWRWPHAVLVEQWPITLYERQSMWRATRSIGARWFDDGATSGCGACPASVWKTPRRLSRHTSIKPRTSGQIISHEWWHSPSVRGTLSHETSCYVPSRQHHRSDDC
jgi:hypothetical protein